MPLFRKYRERLAQRRRKEELERRQYENSQRRKIEDTRAICEGHNHYIPSVPIAVQMNNSWMPVALLRQYLQERDTDIDEDTRQKNTYKILFDGAVLGSFGQNPTLQVSLDWTYPSLDFFTYADYKKFDDGQHYEYLRFLRICHSKAHSELRKFRLVGLSAGEVWYLTPKGNREAESLIADVERWHSSSGIHKSTESEEQSQFLAGNVSPVELLNKIKSMPPDAFERLCQRVLLKAGVEDVEVTGRTGDEGVDGYGVIRLQGLTAVPVVFQAKRYSDKKVDVSEVRDFRGAADGRASTGILITTGTFTNPARDESARVGATKIDLIDGNALVELLNVHNIDLERI